MSKKLFKNEIIGFIFVSIVGTLSHFVYEWSGSKLIIGLFTPVNESSWEHLKLLFFPYLLWSIIELFLNEKGKCIFPAKLIGAVAGMTTIVAFFYTYTGITGKNIDALNILSFFIGVAVAFFTDYILIKSGKLQSKTACAISVIILIIIAALFAVFTIAPPLIPLFKDPQTLTFGI